MSLFCMDGLTFASCMYVYDVCRVQGTCVSSIWFVLLSGIRADYTIVHTFLKNSVCFADTFYTHCVRILIYKIQYVALTMYKHCYTGYSTPRYAYPLSPVLFSPDSPCDLWYQIARALIVIWLYDHHLHQYNVGITP